MSNCYCGRGVTYSDCCEPVISGAQPATTAEQLMRARYSAYVGVQMDFIFESTHPDQRQGYDHAGTKEWAESSDWLGLEIVGTKQGGQEDDIGEVEFIARFSENGIPREHHECARFARKDGHWFFSDGSMVKPKPVSVHKIGRNDPCRCGSGLKYKKCCGK
jgi:SEC-C motif-containing protein